MDIAPLLAAAPAGSVFALDLQTLATIGIQLFNTCFLAAILSFILYKPVRSFMQKRTARIQAQIDEAQAEVAKAAEYKAQYEQKLREVDQERIDILEAARVLAAERADQMIREAKKDAEDIRERARLDVQREFAHAQEGLQRHILDVSSVMAEKLIRTSIDKSIQDKLFAETMAELEEVTWLN